MMNTAPSIAAVVMTTGRARAGSAASVWATRTISNGHSAYVDPHSCWERNVP